MRTAGRCCCRPRPASTSCDGRLQLGRWQRVFLVGAGRPARARQSRCSLVGGGRADEGQDDPAGADRGDQPVLAADQVLAVPAARPGDARRLPATRTTRSRFRTSTSSALDLDDDAGPGRDSGLHHLGVPRVSPRRPLPPPRRVRGARRPARDVAAGGGRARTRTRSSSGPARTPGRSSSPTSGAGGPERVYQSTPRTLAGLPPIRRDLIKRRLYLVPNSIVVSRGCPHVCDFCYKEAFFEGGRVVLHADRRRGARRDRAAARPASLLPRRSPVRRSPLRHGALRRHARHGTPVAGRRHRQRRARAGPAREGRGRGAAQPVRRVRDAQPRQPGRAAEVPEHAPRLRARPFAGCTTSA